MIAARLSAVYVIVASIVGGTASLMPEAVALRPLLGVGGPRVINTLANIPAVWRRQNWLGPKGQGSCVHAAMCHLFRWQGRSDLAGWWQQTHGDGETFPGLAEKLDAAGVKWAGTNRGDAEFLNWAIRTRRGAAVVVADGKHMVNLVGLDRDKAYILDSNEPGKVQAWDRQQFLCEWKSSGGWAVTPVYVPPPPSPKRSDSPHS